MSLDFFILSFVREMHSISISSPRITYRVESISYYQDICRLNPAGIDNDIINVFSSSNEPPRSIVTSDRSVTVPADVNDSFNQSIIG